MPNVVRANSAASSRTPAQVQLFTDGACVGNPGPGGWAYVLKHPATGKVREGSGGHAETTNNKMELTGVIQGLTALRGACEVELYSDSKYVLDGLQSWLAGWKAKGWRTASKQPVKNVELWQQLDALASAHFMRYHWVKGHSGHAENERCDELASAEAAKLSIGRAMDF